MIPDYDIQIWRKINGVCTRIDNNATYVGSPAGEDPSTFLMQEIISIKATQTVAGQVAESEVVFDNDPTKKFAAGDIIIIWLGWEGSSLQKVFNGVVYEAAYQSTDEDKTLTLRARDWSFLLLTDKFTQSYPASENAKDIVLDILAGTIVESKSDEFPADSDDSHIETTGEDYSTIWSAASGDTLYPSEIFLQIGQRSQIIEATEYFHIWRAFIYFDTSTLAGKIVTQAQIRFYCSSKEITGNDFDVVAEKGTSSSYPAKPTTLADYDESKYNNTDICGSTNTSTFGENDYFEITLNAVGIAALNLSGISKFAIRSDDDIAGAPPTSDRMEFIGVSSFEDIEAKRPVLIIQYHEPTSICGILLDPSGVEDTISTRQLDFDGEPLIDSMTKVSDATEHDWYIDEEKIARWFPRRDSVGHPQYRDGVTPPIMTLMREDLIDYNVTDPEELLCNKVKIYGRDNKVIPWGYDDWSDSLGSASEPFEWTGLVGSSCTLQPAPPTPKAGTNSIKISGSTTGTWWEWNHADGWCHTPVPFGPGSLEVFFNFPCPSGKSLRFHSGGCFHSGTGHVEVYYKWGSSGFYIRLLYPEDSIEDEYEDLFPSSPPAPDYVEGPADTDLYVKFKLTGMDLYTTGCMNDFTVYFADDSVSGTEKFSARLRIPSPIVIWSEGGTSFWTNDYGVAEDDSEEVKKGNSSYKITLTAQNLEFYYDYSIDQDYTSKPNIGVWIYGQDTGTSIYLEFWNEVWASRTNGYRYTIVDNFMGWKWFEPLTTDFSNIGIPTGWDLIRCISFSSSSAVTATYRFDWLVNSNPLDQVVDLETKAAPQSLKFVAAPHYGDLPSGISQFLVRFIFADGNTASTLVQFSGIRGDDWTTVEIPVGEDADGWTGNCVGTLQSIEIELTASFAAPPAGGDYLLIDWVHFDGSRWYGEDEDATSELANGIRFKELFDDTLYSDTAASRRAVEYIKKYKDPIITIKDIEAEYIGMENLDPGKALIVSDLIPEFATMSLDNRTYRIETIEHHIEENDYYVKLTLSLDPVYFEGNVYQISERVRRIEQKGRRRPAANPPEVD